MRNILSILAFFLLTASAQAVTVDGFCYLEGQQNHSGTKVKFIKVSPSAVTDSTYTDGSGYFTKNVAAGVYHVEFGFEGFEAATLTNQVLIDPTSLQSVWLLPLPVTNLSGSLSGTIGPGGYRLYGNPPSVSPNDTVFIEPGTVIWLMEPAGPHLQINGTIIAIGDSSNPIVITSRMIPDNRWSGLLFTGSSGNSHLSYCWIMNSRNSGVRVIGSDPIFDNCIFRDNAAGTGGGAFCQGGSPQFIRCTITENYSYGGSDGAVYVTSSMATFNSCIVANNNRFGVHIESSPFCRIQYCDIFGNAGGTFNIVNGGPPILGVLLFTNANGDSADTWYNIFEDPLFTDTSAGDYSLLANSPCIDAGDPELPRDPDSTVADIGAFFYAQDLIVWPRSLEFGSVAVGASDSLLTALYNRSNSPLSIYSLGSSDARFVPRYAETDSVLAAGDTLEVWVVFTPTDSGFFNGELTIISNSVTNDTITIALSGEGGLIPAPVDDVVLQIQNGDATICWSVVDSTIYGSPLTVDAYLIYFAESAAGPFWFHGLTTDSCYTHANVVQFANAMFYEVSAFVGSINGLNQIVEEYDGRIIREELSQEFAAGLWKFPAEIREGVARARGVVGIALGLPQR